MSLRAIGRRIAGERLLGWLDFFRNPEMEWTWGGPFNGQMFRQRIFFELLHCHRPSALVETGTFHGATTSLLAATALPVFTTEVGRRHFAYSRARFLFQRNVHGYNLDSRVFLRELVARAALPAGNHFFYLDAHWSGDLPLREELTIIFEGWERPLVMIDDFEVPGAGYGFDTYGPTQTLDLAYIGPVVGAHDLQVFFPSVDSSVETAARRGCAVLCRPVDRQAIEDSVTTLRRVAPSAISTADAH